MHVRMGKMVKKATRKKRCFYNMKDIKGSEPGSESVGIAGHYCRKQTEVIG
jgi:hypothetical protein